VVQQQISAAAAELSPYYYRDNFIALCDTVERQYGDLLLPAERDFLSCFQALNHASQCLYIRLISRVGPLFRTEKLRYPEIGNLDSPLHCLLDCGLATRVEALTIPELGAIYTRAELLAAFGHTLDNAARCRKDELLQQIQALDLDAGENYLLLSSESETGVVHIQGEPVVRLLQLLFFGNQYQNLTDFILSDLGIARYYPYPLDREQRLFCSRGALDEYLACGECSEAFYALIEAEDVGGIETLAIQMLSREISFGSSRRRWDRLCNRVARELERREALDLALRLYSSCHIHPARERTARILEAQSQWQQVVTLCEEIILEPWCEAEIEAARKIQHRAERKMGGKPVRRARDTFAELRLQIMPQSKSVEDDVADHLAPDWASIHYLENSLMNTLFGLAFWEQIFAPVPGAFHNPYQGAPADIRDGGFRNSRATMIDARLEFLRRADIRQELISCHQRYQNYQCRWVDWLRVDASLLASALAILPREHLLAIWERQLFDPRENCNGFPDLIAFGDSPGEYCMIEVKGPGDALQDNQKRWLRYFARHGIPAQVAWVEWSDG
jgi:hypothetical protein